MTPSECADIETLEQENRQMRARMERLEGERADLLEVLEEATDVVIGHYGTEGRLAKLCLKAIAKVQL